MLFVHILFTHAIVVMDFLIRSVDALKNELEAVGATNNLRGLAANIKFIDRIVLRFETTVNKKLSDLDSHGNDLSPEQAENIMNPKVWGEQGNLPVMYHTVQQIQKQQSRHPRSRRDKMPPLFYQAMP